jgi:uncharacterized protein (DUF983 family)
MIWPTAFSNRVYGWGLGGVYRARQCLLWVISGHRGVSESCPLCAKGRHWPALFNHLLRACEQRRRDAEAERFGGLEVYY